MRYKVRYVPHRNLAASKRSIVVVCGTLAFVLGTTSAGSSFLFDSNAVELAPPNSAILSGFNGTPAEQPLTTRRQPLGKRVPLVISQDKVPTPTAAGTAAASAFVNRIKKATAPEPPVTASVPPPITADPPAPTNPEPTPTEPEPTTPPPAEEPQDPPTGDDPNDDATPAPMMAPSESAPEL